MAIFSLSAAQISPYVVLSSLKLSCSNVQTISSNGAVNTARACSVHRNPFENVRFECIVENVQHKGMLCEIDPNRPKKSECIDRKRWLCRNWPFNCGRHNASAFQEDYRSSVTFPFTSNANCFRSEFPWTHLYIELNRCTKKINKFPSFSAEKPPTDNEKKFHSYSTIVGQALSNQFKSSESIRSESYGHNRWHSSNGNSRFKVSAERHRTIHCR